MIFLTLIPIACLLISHFYFRHKIQPIEYLGQIALPLIVILICKVAIGNIGIWDEEYWGAYTTKAVYEEDWNEYIHQTCTRQVASGTDSKGNTTYTTETYDCSYVDYHPECWWKEDSNGKYHVISKGEYLHLKNLWGGDKKTGHHDGYTNDGDIYTTFFDKKDKNMDVVITNHIYKNKVAASNSIFNFPKTASLDVFNYPKIDNLYTPSVLGYKNCRCFDILNAKYGRSKQIRVWVLIYKNKPMYIFEDQKNHWKGGNKNELVLGIGLKDNKVTWGNVFSWSESDELLVETRGLIESQIGEELNLCELEKQLNPLIKTKWKRKEFKDFDYIKVEPTPTATFMSFIIVLCFSIGLTIFFVMNEV